MLINDVQNVKEIPPIIINELKELGVKCRKEKKIKIIPDKTSRKRIFRNHLHQLELTDVVLANGGIVQIPQFVSEICQRILENVEVEGLFRKAGSSIRQREIKENLESGLPLRKTYHVIDIANVLKSFFRELPESLLPNSIHDTLIRCLLIGDGRIRVKAILMSCLLLPNITINTLAFFMQFLNTIALNSHLNKMSIDNLAIIFTPGLMPAVIPDKSGIRFNNHVKVIRILIENSDMIGILPDSILKKINSEPKMMIASISSQELPQQQQQKEGKKKKRRSGSLTRMFSGIRKIVGVIGSSDSLDTTPVQSNENIIVTPCLSKSAKKRKLENNFAFSNKKRKEIFDSIPSGNGGLLPNTPLCLKEIKKNRLSLGGKKHFKDQLTDKRWSIVGSNWTRKKEKMTWNGIKKSTISVMNTESNSDYQQVLCPVMSTPNMSTNLEDSMNKNNLFCNKNSKSASNLLISKKHDDDCDDENNEVSDNSDYVKVSKREYEAIKKRVAAIETKISQEFSTTMSLYNSSATSVGSSSSSSSMSPNSITSVFNINYDQNKRLSGPEKVLNKFEKTIEETENISSSSSSATTDHLAKRLSRELKIRRSTESNVFRSPSQRKIVSIRRRSRERIRLTRNKTWHVSSRKENVKDLTQNDESGGASDTTFVTEIDNLKRNLTNTLQISLEPSTTMTTMKITKSEIEDLENKENWISGEQFFNTFNDDQEIIENIPITSIPSTTVQTTTKPFHSMQIHIQQQQPTTPKFITRIAVNEVKTPMLPPKLIPRKTPMNIKTPASKMTPNSVSKKLISTPNLEETQNGRASIVRLRALNAGMVLAKAKLFDGLGNETSENQIIQNDHILNKNENRRKSRQFTTIPNRMRSSEPESDFRKEISGGGLNRIEKLKENDHQLQSFSRKSKTPTRKKTGTPQHNLVNQKRSQLSIVASGSSNVGGSGGNNNKIGERILLEKFMNEKQIQTKGNRNKVTSIRNISNNNSDNNNKKHTPKTKKLTIIHSGSPTARKFITTAR